MEPLQDCGRCYSTKYQRPDAKIFLEKTRGFIDSDKMHYSGGDTRKLGLYFCGAAGRNFCITPDGWVTTCYEVSNGLDWRMKFFGIGKFDPINGKYDFYPEKISLLRDYNIYITDKCRKCYARWHCSGDCLAKTINENGEFIIKDRCQFNREIVLGNILYAIEHEGGSSNVKIQNA